VLSRQIKGVRDAIPHHITYLYTTTEIFTGRRTRPLLPCVLRGKKTLQGLLHYQRRGEERHSERLAPNQNRFELAQIQIGWDVVILVADVAFEKT